MTGKNNTRIKEFVLLGLSSDPNLQTLLFVIFLDIYLIIIIGNSLIILATFVDSKLKTPMYFFLKNLSLLDILYSSSIILRMLRDLLAVKKVILFEECVAQMYISLGLGGTECILLAVLAYDRYIAICYPLRYTTIIDKAACIKIAAATWIGGFTLTIAQTVLTWNVDLCGHNVINHFFCEGPEILSLGCGNVKVVEFVILVVGFIAFIAPISFITMTYINIIRAIFKISSSAGRKKTFSTCASHIVVVTMFYGLAAATYMKPRSKSSPNMDKLFAIFYTLITPMLNPLAYTLRNKEVISALIRLKSRIYCFLKG
ncbi:olfactory receptor-like protein OLF3 [Gastrophryne carolinensis]